MFYPHYLFGWEAVPDYTTLLSPLGRPDLVYWSCCIDFDRLMFYPHYLFCWDAISDCTTFLSPLGRPDIVSLLLALCAVPQRVLVMSSPLNQWWSV